MTTLFSVYGIKNTKKTSAEAAQNANSPCQIENCDATGFLCIQFRTNLSILQHCIGRVACRVQHDIGGARVRALVPAESTSRIAATTSAFVTTSPPFSRYARAICAYACVRFVSAHSIFTCVAHVAGVFGI